METIKNLRKTQIAQILIAFLLVACGSDGNKNDSQLDSPTQTQIQPTKTCVVAQENVMLRFYDENDNEFNKLTQVYNCKITKTGQTYVEFKYAQGWSMSVISQDFEMSKWPEDGSIPEFYDSNIDCKTQQCSR